jgi:hypothetical protein
MGHGRQLRRLKTKGPRMARRGQATGSSNDDTANPKWVKYVMKMGSYTGLSHGLSDTCDCYRDA